jgi:hypothetical protein
MTGSGLPHEPPSFINPRIPLDARGIANHPTQHAFLAGAVKAIDATPSLGGDNIPRAIKKNNGERKRRASVKPEHPKRLVKTDDEDAFKREREEEREAMKKRKATTRRRRQVGFTAVASAAFGVLFNAFVSSKKKKKRKRD